jgi:hypothetical protein
MVSATCHHGQWSGLSFNISGEDGHFCSNSLNIQIAKSGVWHLTPCYLYRKENRSSHLKPMPGIMHGVLGASASSTSSPHDTPLTASGDQAHLLTALVRPACWGNQECEPSRPRL